MKRPADLVTVALVALAAYLAVCYLRERAARPRTYYAERELRSLYL